jgi:gliding motility-associated-like protein
LIKVKFIGKVILIWMFFWGTKLWGQFTYTPSDADPCNCSGSVSYQASVNQPYSYQLFDLNNQPIAESLNQNGVLTLSGLCPSVYHLVVEYQNGIIEDDYFEISAGVNSIGDAHRVILCLEAYTTGGGGSIPFDLTSEIGSFLPGGTWYTPNNLIIPTASLSALNASTLDSGWYTYIINSGGCEIVSGIYLQANNTGLTTTYVICETYEPFQMIDFMQGTPDTIGVWYDSNQNIVPGGIYDPATMNDALFTYLIDNLPGCQPVFRSMFVDEQVQRSAGASASIMVCEGSSPFNMLNQLVGLADDGGNWFGPSGAVTPAGSDIFNPSTMQDGLYTYSISSAAPCVTASSTLTIEFTQDNPSGLSASVQLCSNANNLNMLNSLNGSPIVGGTWTSPSGDVVDGTFDPDSEPAGNYQYYYPNVGCSPGSSILSISVEAPVNAGANGTATICQTNTGFNLNSMLSSNATIGGAWQLNGTSVGSSYTPSAPGSFNFTYNVNASVCADDQSAFTVFVQPAVAAPLSQTIYLCSLGEEVNLNDYFTGLSSVYFENSNGALVSSLFDPAQEVSTTLEVVNPSGNSCPDQEGQLNIQVLQPVIDDTTLPVDVCRSNLLFDLNSTIPPIALGMGTWLNTSNEIVSNSVPIDFTGTVSYTYEVIQPISCGGEQLQIDLITFTPNDAGDDASEIFCYTDGPQLLSNLLPASQINMGEWYFNNNPFNSTSFDPGNDASGTYIYRIPANGPCPADEALLNLTVQQGINYTAGPDIHVCAGSASQTIGGQPSPNTTFSWTPTSALNNSESPTPLVNIPGNVNQTSITLYTVFADDGICTFTDYVQVIVEPNPIVNLNNEYDICFGESLTLNEVSNGNCSWTPTNLFANTNSTSPTLQPTSSVYIGVTATSDFGCTTSAFSQLNVNPLPILIVQPGPMIGCKPLELELHPSAESQYVDQIVWNVAGMGTFLTDSLRIELTQPGTYDVEATAISAEGCASSIFLEEVSEVYPSPVAHFSISPTELTTLEPEATLSNSSVGAVAYNWNFSGLGESDEENPTFIFPNDRSNNFYVCLEAVNSYGCRDTSCRYVYMETDYIVFAPNAFTPDDDGDNDIWLPVIRGFDTSGYELNIFNRWGKVVFHSENPNEPWTGSVNDGDYYGQNEVYNWRLKLRLDHSSEEIFFDGNIVLIR